MLRLISRAVVFAVLAATGCAGVSFSPPKPPPPAGEESRRVKGREPPPKLIAPPPAYGNKIVMAGRESPTVVN
jgi:hypothetical protein